MPITARLGNAGGENLQGDEIPGSLHEVSGRGIAGRMMYSLAIHQHTNKVK